MPSGLPGGVTINGEPLGHGGAPSMVARGCSDLCQPNPVRDALTRYSVSQIESARDTTRIRARQADNPDLAAMLNQVAAECDAAVNARLLSELTRAVPKESQEQTSQMRDLVTQMTG